MHKLSKAFDIYNLAVLLFFCMLLAMNAFVNTSTLVIAWYFSGCFCFLLGILLLIHKLSLKVLLFILICIFSSLVCYRVNHNLSITQYIYIMMCPIIGLLLADPCVRANTLKYVIVIYATYILFSFLTGGIQTQVFLTSSTNFVSVFLLYPTVIYYTKLESEDQKISVYPIAVIWVLCILARGRGGILTTTFLLFWIILHAYKEQLKNRKTKIIIGCALVIVGFVAIMCIIATSDIWLQWDAFEYFSNRGLESKSRFAIWGEYFEAIQRHPIYLLYGAPFTDLKLQVTEIHNNMHNSFFNIHIYNGLVMFIIVLIYLINAFRYGLHKRKFIYLACLLTFCMRAFTDNVFWGPYGTPVFFFLLFFPYDLDQNRKSLLNCWKWSFIHDKPKIKIQ